MRTNLEIACRFVCSYKMMLNFYGLRLTDLETGTIEKHSHWKSRFLNLRFESHNYLRINRILACLGHLGFDRYRKPLIDFFGNEISAKDSLLTPCKYSFENFWIEALTPDSSHYKRKTKETSADRVDSIFFQHLKENTQEFQAWQQQMSLIEFDTTGVKSDAIAEDMQSWDHYVERMSRTRVARSMKKHEWM